MAAGAGRGTLQSIVGNSAPDLTLPQQRNAEIAANGELISVRAQLHSRTVDRTIAWIENRSVLVSQATSPHASDERDASHWRILLLALATRAAPLRRVWLSGLRKHLYDLPFESTAALHDTKPGFGATRCIHFFPQASSSRLLGLRRERSESCNCPQNHSGRCNVDDGQAHSALRSAVLLVAGLAGYELARLRGSIRQSIGGVIDLSPSGNA